MADNKAIEALTFEERVFPPSDAAEPGYRIRIFGEQCLSGASCAAILFGAGVEFTRRVAHGRKWFWVILPKQKNLVARGRNPASNKWKN